MNISTYFSGTRGFLAGIIFGLTVVGIYSFSVPAGNPGSGATPVTVAEAHAQFLANKATAVPFNQVLTGFTLDKIQVEAMNNILRENASVSGFRVYLGKDKAGQRTAVVVGVDNSGHDAVSNTIYSTMSLNCNACPPVCDFSSPITVN